MLFFWLLNFHLFRHLLLILVKRILMKRLLLLFGILLLIHVLYLILPSSFHFILRSVFSLFWNYVIRVVCLASKIMILEIWILRHWGIFGRRIISLKVIWSIWILIQLLSIYSLLLIFLFICSLIRLLRLRSFLILIFIICII